MMEAWEDFSRFSGLKLESHLMLMLTRIVGNYQGYFVNIELHILPALQAGAVFYSTRISLDLGFKTIGYFSLQGRGFFDKKKNDVGDDRLNKLFVIESEPKDFFEHILSEDDIRNQLLLIHPDYLFVKEGELFMFMDGIETNYEKIKILLDFLFSIAKIVTDRKKKSNSLQTTLHLKYKTLAYW